jgi:outer membrane protein TolC
MSGRTICLVFIFLSIPALLKAQELLKMEDAIVVALENNFGIRIAVNESEISRNNNTAGNAGFLPELSLYGAYDYSLTDAKMDVASGVELDENNASTNWVNTGLVLHWTLFDGTNMFIDKEKLEKMEELGAYELRISMENTVAGVIVAYIDIIQKEILLNVLQDQVDLSRFRFGIAEAKRSVGTGSEFELLQAHVDMNSDISLFQTHKAAVINAKTSLNELLARDLSLDFQVADSIILQPALVLSEIIQNASTANSELQAEQLQRDISLLEMKEMKANRFPVVGFEAGYSYLRNQTEATFIQYNRQFGPHLGFTLDFTIFDGFNKNREVQNAGISYENAELQREQLQQSIESQVIRVFNEYNSEVELISFERMNLALAQKNMDIALEAYKVGSVSSIEVREVQRNLLSAQLRLIIALYRAKVKETELLLLSGKLIQ